MNKVIFFFCLFFLSSNLVAQVIIEGYVYESGNRGYIENVNVQIYDESGIPVCETITDSKGYFSCLVEENQLYKMMVSNHLFESKSISISTENAANNSKIFQKIELIRSPGYIFEITIAESRESVDTPVDAIRGVHVEVYNNTTKKEELDIRDNPNPDFRIQLEQGNHYSILLRKKGYLAKHMEAFVNVDGCILCFEGVGKVEPGVTENLTMDNSVGTLLANVEMEKLFQGKTIELKNIFYDFGKWNIRDDAKIELDKVVDFLKDNGNIKAELGAHTDSRGSAEANMILSEKRAKAAADYLRSQGIDAKNLIHKGYGETALLNKCQDDVNCSEAEHQINRRTELKIVGIDELIAPRSLFEQKKEEELNRLIEELQNQEQVKIPVSSELPEDFDPSVLDSLDTDQLKNMMVSSEDNHQLDAIEIENPQMIEEEIKKTPENEDVATNSVPILIDTNDKFKESTYLDQYTGYKIVIFYSVRPTDQDHQVFSKTREQITEYTTEHGDYRYLIGDFESASDAKSYLDEHVSKNYPSAYIIHFVNGQRMK